MEAKDISTSEKDFETRHENVSAVDDVAPDDTDNYHGLSVRTVLVYLSLNLILGGQLLNLIGAGALSRNISAVVGGANNAFWLSTIIGIMTCVLGPPVAQAADYWGRKWFIVILTVFGFIGAMVVSRATSMYMAIGGQILAGVAFGSQPLLYAVASEILPRRWRPEAQAGLTATIGIATIFGLCVGFKLTEDSPEGFRTYFYIAAGINAVAAIICAFLYNPPLRPLQVSLSLKEKLARLDWLGYAFLLFGIVLFAVALSWSQNPYSWNDVHIIAPFVIGSVLLIIFGIYQWKFRRDGMFHHGLFKKDRNFAIASFSLFVEGAMFFSANNYFVFEMLVLYEKDTILAGMRFGIASIAATVASTLVALYCSRTKKLRIPTALAFVSFVIFNILMATATLSSGIAMWGYPVFLGIGLGVCLTCLVTAAQLSVDPALISISSGLLISIRSLGAAIALAIYNAIFNSQFSTVLAPNIGAAVLPLGLSPEDLPALINALVNSNQAALMQITGVTPQIIGAGVTALQESYLQSFRYIWLCAGVLSAVASISALFLINPAKDMNMHVDAPLEESEN
ncbi:major facilitator superfamily domain-containing protein [Leptodontidium sp. 2 PMI_412]|nr:major facilitator superfamily domain-containing protein [Leptodontidium sp. 2 PMI_412]